MKPETKRLLAGLAIGTVLTFCVDGSAHRLLFPEPDNSPLFASDDAECPAKSSQMHCDCDTPPKPHKSDPDSQGAWPQ